MTYIFRGLPERKSSGELSFEVLPEGDYPFEVLDCWDPYEKDNGNTVVKVSIKIIPQGVAIFAYPWSGEDKNKEWRDGIAEFLLCVNRAPAIGTEPDWNKVIGARGKCHLKTEIYKEKERNAVAWFLVPHKLDEQLPKVGPKPPAEPDDLPF